MTTCYHLENRIFYVHIPKCAGSSIGGTFKDGIWQTGWLEENLPGWSRDICPNGHQPVRAIESITGHPIDWWDDIVVTIRNPFQQQASQYEFWRRRGLNGAANGLVGHPDDRFAASCTFGQFVTDGRSNGPNACCGDAWAFYGGVYRWWASDLSGNVAANVKIVQVEALGKLQNLMMEWSGEIPTEIPNVNRTDVKWQDYYDRRTWDVVRHKFGWSLANFYPHLLECNYATAQSVA